MSEQTVKCHICGQPYKVYAYMAGDQSACPSCIAQANYNQRTIVTAGTSIEYRPCKSCGGSGHEVRINK